MEDKKHFYIQVVLGVVLILTVLVVVFILFSDQFFKGQKQSNNQNDKPEKSFCTADAKECPDGSFVGRDGSNNCEFFACPETSKNSNSGFLEDTDAGNMGFPNLEWQEFTDGDVNFRAPKEIMGLNYVGFDYWPPRVSILGSSYTCEETEFVVSGSIYEKEIQGRTYCIETWIEGAAGSTYTDYAYTVALDDTTIAKIAFTVRMPQCLNYDSPKSEDCIIEEKEFSMDRVVDTIVESLAEPELTF